MMLFLLCLMLALPAVAMADEAVKNFQLQGYEMGFTYSFDCEEEYVALEYATDAESGRMVLYSEDGHFEGEGILQ